MTRLLHRYRVFRLHLGLILIFAILFTSALLIVHAQLYDNHELRDLLLPDGCPAPCFMGIRPGGDDDGRNLRPFEIQQMGWRNPTTFR